MLYEENFGNDLFCAVVNEMTTADSLQFDFKKIEAATNKFSEENKLGEGGFGSVFKVSISYYLNRSS